MGNDQKKQAKPKGRYLAELHKKVPNMNIDEILAIYADFQRQSGGKDRLSRRDFVEVYQLSFGKGKGVKQLAERIFDSFDTDNSGAVDFEEFLIGLSITEEAPEQVASADREARMKRLNWAFSVYDKDKSGTIDKKEMRLIVKAVSEILPDEMFLKGKTPKQYADELFKSVDVNNDGEITFHEFVAAAEQDETIIDLLLPPPS